MSSRDPRLDAGEVFRVVIDDLSTGITVPSMVVSAVRRCQHACQILGWKDHRDYFAKELTGYSDPGSVPFYRVLNCTAQWADDLSVYDPNTFAFALFAPASARSHNPQLRLDDESVSRHIVVGVEEIAVLADRGHIETTDEITEYKIRTDHWSAPARRLRKAIVYPVGGFQRILREIGRTTFDFASASYSLLQYGDALQDVWEEYRSKVEQSLGKIGMSNKAKAIHDGLNSDNPEDSRLAVLECRNLLEDLAGYLWRDPRETYDHLPGTGKGQKLKVTSDKYVNRLCAYLHQKRVFGTEGELVRDELERLGASIRSLVGAQSKAHTSLTRESARSIALFTYLVLGEIVTRTDIQPVHEYSDPTS